MTTRRQQKILQIISQSEVDTQEKLVTLLSEEGFSVTQSTVCRDIKKLNLTKVPLEDGRQKYVAPDPGEESLAEDNYIRILKAGFHSMDRAQNILVIKTSSGMAMAVAAALDAMKFPEIVGCIAGDDTIMAAVRTSEDARRLMKKIHTLLAGIP